MIRTFIGIELDGQIAHELNQEISYLKSYAPKIRWVSPDALHLTLKFLGDVQEKDLPDVFTATSNAAAELDAVTAEVGGVAAFPNLKHPRVVVADIASGRDELAQIASVVDDCFEEFGYPPEKRGFKPHITLGRVKQPHDAEGLHEVIDDAANASFGLLDVAQIVVFMSDLRRTGPVYAPMHRVDLNM